MKVNFHRSEIIPMNVSIEVAHDVSHIFNYCPLGSLPIKYLGVPLHYAKLRREDIYSIFS